MFLHGGVCNCVVLKLDILLGKNMFVECVISRCGYLWV